MMTANEKRYTPEDAIKTGAGTDNTETSDSKMGSRRRHPADDQNKIIHIFGCPNSGKTTLRKALAERHPDYQSYCIDDFRRRYGDGSFEGESYAQIRFGDEMMKGGFFECSGTGMSTVCNLSAYRNRPQYIVVLDAPADDCISRMVSGKYVGIPFPFPDTDEDYIWMVSIYLSSEMFARVRRGIPTLWLDSDIPLDVQIEEVERFAGLEVEGMAE